MNETHAWLVTRVEDAVHGHPVDDLIEHTLDDDCPCGPLVDAVKLEDGSIVWKVLHHSLDGREHQEPDHDRAACPACAR